MKTKVDSGVAPVPPSRSSLVYLHYRRKLVLRVIPSLLKTLGIVVRADSATRDI